MSENTNEITHWKYHSTQNIWSCQKRADGLYDWGYVSGPEENKPPRSWPTTVRSWPPRPSVASQVSKDGSPYNGNPPTPTLSKEMEIKLFRWYKCSRQNVSTEIGHTIRIVPNNNGENMQNIVSFDLGEAVWIKENGQIKARKRLMERTFFLEHYKPCDPPTAPSSIKDPTIFYKEPQIVQIDYWPEHW